MSLGNYWGNRALEYMINDRDVWVALHISNPGPTGIPASELTGGDYERIEGSFLAASGKSVVNNEILIWDNLPACVITYGGVWDSLTGGHIIAYGAFASPRTIANGGQYAIAEGELAVTI